MIRRMSVTVRVGVVNVSVTREARVIKALRKKGSIDDVDDHNDRKLDNTHCWDGSEFVKDPLRH
jgi:hypothetical protein